MGFKSQCCPWGLEQAHSAPWASAFSPGKHASGAFTKCSYVHLVVPAAFLFLIFGCIGSQLWHVDFSLLVAHRLQSACAP